MTRRNLMTFDQVIRAIVAVIAIAILIWLVNYLKNVLLPFCVACLIAYVLEPLVVIQQNKLRLKRRIIPDLTVNLYDSDNWGMIGDYESNYQYELKDTEYVQEGGRVWRPTMNPVADTLKEGYNFRYHDPRNPNVKKHMIEIALFELHKLISPNNVSSARITDYEATLQWLHDANLCKINPGIPRKLDEEKKPVSEIAIATFMRSYDPYQNPGQI